MIGKILTAAAPLALLAFLAGPAAAADYARAAPAYGPASWADVSVSAGIARWTDNFDNSDTCSVFNGEGRWGTGVGGAVLQLDASGRSIDCGNQEASLVLLDQIIMGGSSSPNFDLAAHLGLSGGPGTLYGIMGSIGEEGSYDRFATIAAEGVWALGFGPSRLIAQAGWSTGLNYDESIGYIHGVLDFAINQDALLSVNLGYASNDSGQVFWRYGAKGEMAFNPNVSGFIEWKSLHGTQTGYSWDNNTLLVGATFHVNEGPLATISPLHDYNLATGVNARF